MIIIPHYYTNQLIVFRFKLLQKVLKCIRVFNYDDESNVKWEVKYKNKIYLKYISAECSFEVIFININFFILSRCDVFLKKTDAPN